MHHMHVHSCKLFKCKYKVDMIHLNSDHDIFCSTRLWGKFSKICINLPKKMHKHKTCSLENKQRNNSKKSWWMRDGHLRQTPCKLWQYRLWSFQGGATKLERFLPKNQLTQRKWLNFEFWINGELSKIGHHFSNKIT